MVELAAQYHVPAPMTEAQLGRLLDRWEAELAAKLAVASTVFALTTPAAATLAGAAFPGLLSGARLVLVAAVSVLSLFGLLSALSALGLCLRSGLGEPSWLVKVGVPLSIVVSFFMLLAGAGALFLSGLPD